MHFKVEPVPAEQRDWLYSDSVKDAERGCIGHLRFDTGRSGKEFWTSWWPHNEALNRQPFKKELDQALHKYAQGDAGWGTYPETSEFVKIVKETLSALDGRFFVKVLS